MADSNITKSALASALKELMETTPFAKITVSDICATVSYTHLTLPTIA